MGRLAEAIMKGKAQLPAEKPEDISAAAWRDAIKEAWDCSKTDNFDGFADAIKAAVDIRMSEQGEE